MASASVAATAAISTSPPSDERPPARPDGAPDSALAAGQKSSSTPAAHFSGRADTNEGGTNHTNDGRVKNPVPGKLKGMADNKNGNFGVMHIDINSSQAALRNAAAKRTSEETEAAAKLANMRGYQSIKRSKLAWNPTADQQDSSPHSVPAATAAMAAAVVASTTSTTSTPAPPTPLTPRSGPPNSAGAYASSAPTTATHIVLAPHEIKMEQARLLTLLRSLHPVVVVDQLCKALAYFGGIPGAPPPNDNLFPESAKRNGQGSLFIGWVSEIFPPIEGGSTAMPPPTSTQHPQPSPATPAAASAAVITTPTPASAPPPAPPPPAAASANADTTTTPTTPFKRPRGRPKGSKSSKVRKDKGIRKSDIALSASELVESVGASSSSLNPTQQEPSPVTDPKGPGSSNQPPQFVAVNSLSQPEASSQFDPDSSIMSTPGTGKRRGRPKGSKNRPKNASEAASSQGVSDPNHPALPTPNSITNQSSQSPLIQKSAQGYAIPAPPENGLHRGPEQRQLSPTKIARKDVLEQTGSVGSQLPTAGESTFTSTPNWAGTGMQPPDSRQQNVNSGNQSMSRKRKPGELGQVTDIDSSEASPRIQQQDMTINQNTLSEQTMGNKRRRASKDINQAAFTNVDSNSPRLGMTASSAMNNAFNGVPQSMSTSNFEAQMSGATRKITNQHIQQHQSQQHSMQAQQASQNQPTPNHQQHNHQFSAQTLQQQASAMRSRPQQHQGQMPPAGSRPRSQAPIYSAAPTSISQSYYAQHRQMPSPMGQVANNSNGFGRSGSAQSATQFSPGMARQTSNDGNVVNIVQQQQGAVPGARRQQGQSAGRQPSSFTNQQAPSSSAPASSLNQFQGFGEQAYLEMDYALNDHSVQEAAAAFSDSHLEALAAEPHMRERLYQAMSRR